MRSLHIRPTSQTFVPIHSCNILRVLLWGAVVIFMMAARLTPAADQPKKFVYRIPINGMIDRGVAPYVRRVLAEAQTAEAVILEIDTPGGMVDSALQIRDALLDSKVQTIAFINKRAISAGALISLATDHIVMSPGGTIGAATPIQLSGTTATPVDEKYVSYFRAEMRATAEEKGRRADIAEAMVDADVEIEGVIAKEKLLTLTTKDALKYGIAEYEATSLTDVLEKLNLSGAEIRDVGINWAEQFVRFLTNPVVSSLLMTVGLIGLFIEFKTPGFGLPGATGLICLGLFFWGHFIVRLAGLEEVLLFFVGVVLLLIEIFVIPGFGVVGVVGILAILTSLALATVGRFELLTLQDIQSALLKVVIILFASLVVSFTVVKFLPQTGMGKHIILQTTEEQEDGYVAQPNDYAFLVGMEGVTLTPLRPSGTVEIAQKRYAVVSEGQFIEPHTRVKVLEVEGARIVVREVEKTTTA